MLHDAPSAQMNVQPPPLQLFEQVEPERHSKMQPAPAQLPEQCEPPSHFSQQLPPTHDVEHVAPDRQNTMQELSIQLGEHVPDSQSHESIEPLEPHARRPRGAERGCGCVARRTVASAAAVGSGRRGAYGPVVRAGGREQEKKESRGARGRLLAIHEVKSTPQSFNRAAEREAPRVDHDGRSRENWTVSFDLDTIAQRLAALAPDPSAASAPGLKRAAVAAVLRERNVGGEAELLFIRRAEHPSDPWSGHMAWPGGRHDPADSDLLSTAVRETREEVGIDLGAHATLLARLPDVHATARGVFLGLVIAPFVFSLKQDREVVKNHEVAETVWTPLGPLIRGEGRGTFPYVYQGQELELPCLRIGSRVVWGLTYQMLMSLGEALKREG